MSTARSTPQVSRYWSRALGDRHISSIRGKFARFARMSSSASGLNISIGWMWMWQSVITGRDHLTGRAGAWGRSRLNDAGRETRWRETSQVGLRIFAHHDAPHDTRGDWCEENAVAKMTGRYVVAGRGRCAEKRKCIRRAGAQAGPGFENARTF